AGSPGRGPAGRGVAGESRALWGVWSASGVGSGWKRGSRRERGGREARAYERADGIRERESRGAGPRSGRPRHAPRLRRVEIPPRVAAADHDAVAVVDEVPAGLSGLDRVA